MSDANWNAPNVKISCTGLKKKIFSANGEVNLNSMASLKVYMGRFR